MTRSSLKKRGITPIAIGGSLLIAAIGAAQLLGGRVYYPHVVVDAVENVRLEFLQEGLAKGEDCDAAAAAIVDAVRASCPTCRVATQQCRDRLEPRYEKLLSEEPVAMPSSRLPHGVVAYVSDNKGLALAACSESERLTGASPGFRTICHQPNTPRPLPGSAHPQLAGVWQVIFSPPAFLLFGLAFAGFLFVRSAAPHARWGALAHGYFPSRLRSEERRVGKECRSLCDWSSDVCSSDLFSPIRIGFRRLPLRSLGGPARALGSAGSWIFPFPAEIGRASCRERV